MRSGHSVVLLGVSSGHPMSKPLVLEEPLNLFGVYSPPLSEERTLDWWPVWSSSQVTKAQRVSIALGHAFNEIFAGLVVYQGGKVEETLV